MTFDESVYAAVRLIPRGRVATYGQIALLCGNPRASRAVGWALRRNPSPGAEIPCHRVVNREGRLAPAFAFGGPGAQRDLLEAEGVPFFADGRVDLKHGTAQRKADLFKLQSTVWPLITRRNLRPRRSAALRQSSIRSRKISK